MVRKFKNIDCESQGQRDRYCSRSTATRTIDLQYYRRFTDKFLKKCTMQYSCVLYSWVPRYKIAASGALARTKVKLYYGKTPCGRYKDRMSSYFKYMILQDSIESHIKSNRSLQVYHLRYSLKVAKVEVISSDVSQQTHKRSDIGETTSKKFESHLSCLCEYHKSLGIKIFHL